MRTFIAIELPPPVQQQIGIAQRALAVRVQAAGLGDAVRWTPAEKIHLTLRFLGDTTEEQRTELAATLGAITASHSSFDLRLDGWGCFPNERRPSVIWLGVGEDLAALNALQSRVELAARNAGFEAERRAFSPHLTIGRVQRNADNPTRRQLGQSLQAPDQVAADVTFTVNRIAHIRSVLKPTGAVYTPLSTHRL